MTIIIYHITIATSLTVEMMANTHQDQYHHKDQTEHQINHKVLTVILKKACYSTILLQNYTTP